MRDSAFGISLALHRVILGSWDASLNEPDVLDLPFIVREGQKYYVSVTGTVDIGQGLQEYTAGDYISWFSDTGWIKSDNTPLASETGNDSTVVGASVADALDTNKLAIEDAQTDIDDHLADLANPHDTSLANLNQGTISELNALITDLIPTYGGVRDIGVGTTAQRPVASVANRFYWDTQTGVLYRDDSLVWQTVGAIPVMVLNTQVIYVSKVGDDGDDGLTINTPKLTIGSAITWVNTQTPSDTNRFKVEILDAGIYVENFTVPTYTSIVGHSANITGNVLLSDLSVYNIHRHVVLTGIGIMKTTGTEGCLVDIHGLVCVGSAYGMANTTTGSIDANMFFCSIENGGGIGDASSTGHIHINVNSMTVTGTGFGIICVGVGRMSGYINELTGTGIGVDVDGGEVNLKINKLDNTTAYDVETGGILNLIVCDLTGTELNDGTANVLKASDSVLFNDATPTERGLMGIVDQAFAGLKTFNTPIRMPSLNINEMLKGDSLGDVVNSGVKAETTGEEGSILNMAKFTSAPIAPIDGDFWFREDGAQTFIERYEGGVTYSVEMGSI